MPAGSTTAAGGDLDIELVAEPDPRPAASDAQGLVAGAVEVREGIDPVAPRRWPAVPREQDLEGAGRVKIGRIDRAADEDQGKTTVGDRLRLVQTVQRDVHRRSSDPDALRARRPSPDGPDQPAVRRRRASMPSPARAGTISKMAPGIGVMVIEAAYEPPDVPAIPVNWTK